MNRGLLALVMVAVVTVAVPAPAMAAGDSISLFESAGNDAETGLSIGLSGDRVEIIQSTVDRVAWNAKYDSSQLSQRVSARVGIGDEVSTTNEVDTHAQNLRETFNENSDTLESHVNTLGCGCDESTWNVIEVEMRYKGGATSIFLVADVTDGGEFQNASAVNSTDRTVDRTLGLNPYATVRADDELQTYVDKFASQGEAPTIAYLKQMSNQYSGEIDLPQGVTIK